jgi:hypothetical protein
MRKTKTPVSRFGLDQAMGIKMKFLIIHPIRRDFNHPTQKIAVSGIAS